MNERTTLEKIAPTVDEAILEGLTELGLAAESVDVEVLDKGSHGLFGVGSRQARVRLTVKMDSSESGNNPGKSIFPVGWCSPGSGTGHRCIGGSLGRSFPCIGRQHPVHFAPDRGRTTRKDEYPGAYRSPLR